MSDASKLKKENDVINTMKVSVYLMLDVKVGTYFVALYAIVRYGTNFVGVVQIICVSWVNHLGYK